MEFTVISDDVFEEWCNKHCKYKNGVCSEAQTCAVCDRKAQSEDTLRQVVEWLESKPRVFSKGYGFATVISDMEMRELRKQAGLNKGGQDGY